MKIILSKKKILLLVSFSSILFNVDLINGCEKTCRVGISTTFAEKYSNVTSPLWQDFFNDLESTALENINLENYVQSDDAAPITNKLITTLKNHAQELETNFDAQLPTIIEDAIFRQQPQFRGDCNHPFRVKQPKPPKIWKMSDCEKMDYICGNPPSICHFLPMIKERNVRTIKTALEEASTKGEFLNVLTLAVNDTLTRTGAFTEKDFTTLLTTVKSNIESRLGEFYQKYNEEFCKETSCDQFDLEIKTQLLTYP
ncbi:3220_t:CDS:1 [Ambispora leptoticha]|uniref:3220_t:CDS:1 n=1 Tax=Ambispora leptoticha TaxID=144679 RepID=A0A9N9GCA6_9GLOM|nr:3220_t:CDS:1 [Ambispora leptoticha]